ncbi:MAG: GAF domain-containing protein [Anaerolineae bacterium]|nr:GAF domain-containing protein [Anaerolineae bacterium]
MSDTLEPNYQVIHVLLIKSAGEDRYNLRDLLNQFSHEQFRIDQVDTVDSGLEKLKASLPDVILVDLDRLGDPTEKTINRLVSAAPEIPVIALMELSNESRGIKAMECGAFDYLIREQITEPLVKHCLRHLLRSKRLLNEYENHRAHMQIVMETHTNALRKANLRLQQEIEERKQAEESEHRIRLLSESLREITSCLISSTDLNEIYRRILVGLKNVFPHDAANIMLVDMDKVHVVDCLGYDQVGTSHEQMLGISYDMASLPGLLKMMGEGTPQIFNDVRENPDWLANPKSDWIRSYAGAPIRIGDEVIGFLNLDSATPHIFTLEHGLLLQAFADQAAIAIRNARLYQELEHYSIALQQAVNETTREAREARDRIEVVFNSVGEGLIVVGFNQIIQRVNPAFEKLTGYSANRIAGMEYPILIPDVETARQHLSQISAAMRSQGTWSGEFPIRRLVLQPHL